MLCSQAVTNYLKVRPLHRNFAANVTLHLQPMSALAHTARQTAYVMDTIQIQVRNIMSI